MKRKEKTINTILLCKLNIFKDLLPGSEQITLTLLRKLLGFFKKKISTFEVWLT